MDILINKTKNPNNTEVIISVVDMNKELTRDLNNKLRSSKRLQNKI